MSGSNNPSQWGSAAFEWLPALDAKAIIADDASLLEGKRDIIQLLSTEKRSAFYRCPEEILESHVLPLLEVASLPTPPYPKGSKLIVDDQIYPEGFLLQKYGDELEYIYFACPGSIILASPFYEIKRKKTHIPYRSCPHQVGKQVTLNSLVYSSKHLITLRTGQIAGLLEFLNAKSDTMFNFAKHSTPLKCRANMIASNHSYIFRMKVNDFFSLHLSNQLLQVNNKKSSLSLLIVCNSIYEITKRISDANFISSLMAEGNHLGIIAKYLLDFEVTGKVSFSATKPRIRFYTGLGDHQINPALQKLKQAGAFVERKAKRNGSGEKDKYTINFDKLRKLLNDAGYSEEVSSNQAGKENKPYVV